MTLFRLTKKQIVIRLILLAALLIGGAVWLCVRACPTWHSRIQVPPEVRDGSVQSSTQEDLLPPPEGYARIPAAEDSFLHFMRTSQCWPAGSSIMTYDGKPLSGVNAAAVYTLPLPDSGYQECADTIMVLWGNYLYNRQEYDRIAFSFSNGYETKYTDWREGWRYVTLPLINKTFRVKLAGEDGSDQQYFNYCEAVMRYAGTLSLEAESHTISPSEAQTGDMLCQGGAPGHAVVIVDEARNADGKRCFLLAQGFMPSQSAHIIAGVQDSPLGKDCPWYTEEQLAGSPIHLSSFTFQPDALRRWKDGFPNTAAAEEGV